MAFDKDTYWKNRKAGKRGQGEEPKAKVIPNGIGSNRKEYRRKVRKSFYGMIENARGRFKKNETGKPFTAKGVKHRNGSTPFSPSQDPNVPNKVRVRNQRIRSGRIKIDEPTE